MAQRTVSESPIEAICPLCGGRAKKFLKGDRNRYECPEDKTFDIADSIEAEIRANSSMAKSHRERVERERKRGITIPKVGIF